MLEKCHDQEIYRTGVTLWNTQLSTNNRNWTHLISRTPCVSRTLAYSYFDTNTCKGHTASVGFLPAQCPWPVLPPPSSGQWSSPWAPVKASLPECWIHLAHLPKQAHQIMDIYARYNVNTEFQEQQVQIECAMQTGMVQLPGSFWDLRVRALDVAHPMNKQKKY